MCVRIWQTTPWRRAVCRVPAWPWAAARCAVVQPLESLTVRSILCSMSACIHTCRDDVDIGTGTERMVILGQRWWWYWDRDDTGVIWGVLPSCTGLVLLWLPHAQQSILYWSGRRHLLHAGEARASTLVGKHYLYINVYLKIQVYLLLR